MAGELVTHSSLTVIRDAVEARTAGPIVGGHRMYLYSESRKLRLGISIAPRDIEYGGWANDWAQTPRPGAVPLLLHSSVPLPTMAFSFLLADKHSMVTASTRKLAALRQIAGSLERILVRYSTVEQGLWRVTDLSVTSELRTPDTNEPARTKVSITLTQASDAAPAVGPISKPPPPPPPPPVAPPSRMHIVVKGNTLWGIALQYYGSGPAWPRIFDANRDRIKDPHWIYPNQKFVIP